MDDRRTYDIEAVPTSYKDVLYRSKLEVRWAYFFTDMGVEFEYEKQRLYLGDGMSYLPDFWLPQIESWAEVKPDRFTNEEVEKCRRLTLQTRKPCLLLAHEPHMGTYASYFVSKQTGSLETAYVSLIDIVQHTPRGRRMWPQLIESVVEKAVEKANGPDVGDTFLSMKHIVQLHRWPWEKSGDGA